MIWTAYLHPDFAEELALLPSPLRVGFYAQLMAQSTKGPLDVPLDYYYPHGNDSGISIVFTKFHYLGYEPKFLLSFDTKIIPEAFIYLHLAGNLDDAQHCAVVERRIDSVRTGKLDLIKAESFLRRTADPEEYRQALKINADIASLAINRYFLDEAFREAKEEAATIFNLCAPQMERLLTRFDYFFGVLQQKLRDKGGAAAIEISFKGAESRLVHSLKDFSTRPDKRNLGGD